MLPEKTFIASDTDHAWFHMEGLMRAGHLFTFCLIPEVPSLTTETDVYDSCSAR